MELIKEEDTLSEVNSYWDLYTNEQKMYCKHPAIVKQPNS